MLITFIREVCPACSVAVSPRRWRLLPKDTLGPHVVTCSECGATLSRANVSEWDEKGWPERIAYLLKALVWLCWAVVAAFFFVGPVFAAGMSMYVTLSVDDDSPIPDIAFLQFWRRIFYVGAAVLAIGFVCTRVIRSIAASKARTRV